MSETPETIEAPNEIHVTHEAAETETMHTKVRASDAASHRRARPVRTQHARAEKAEARRATSDVSALRSLGLALPLYGAAILAARAAPPQARSILLERGWPPHATMLLACLALSILLSKTIGLVRQRRAFQLDLLPAGPARIAPEAAARAASEVESMRHVLSARSFLVERVLRVLSQYAANGDVAEATAANEADADADASSVAASFSTPKVLVWTMPILGLIGTVVGLSGAVGAFSHAMSGADQLDTIKDSLRQVTTGLAVAFDATFVALVASILVMLPMTWLQKAEDKLIADVDDYCATNLLARLAARGDAARASGSRESASRARASELAKAVADALAEPLAAMLAANGRLSDALSSAAPTMERAASDLGRAAGALERSAASVAPAMEGVVVALAKTTQAVVPSVERAVGTLERASTIAMDGMDRSLAQLVRANGLLEERIAPALTQSGADLGRATVALTESVGRAVTQLEATARVADHAAGAAERAQDQLGRELGASRKLLCLLAAGLGAEAPASRGTNGLHANHGTAACQPKAGPREHEKSNGANGTHAAQGM